MILYFVTLPLIYIQFQNIVVILINFNNIMRLSDPQPLLDCLSAQQLLHALNALQKINEKNEELQLSFNESSTSLFNTMSQHQQQHMDFQIYMAMKNGQNDQTNNKNRKTKNKNFVRKNNQGHFDNVNNKLVDSNKHNSSHTPRKNNKKSITPTKIQQKKIVQYKSRSHSPALKLVTPKKQGYHNKKNKKAEKQNIENRATQRNSAHQMHKVSEKSKMILQQKQKKGQVYIPIQYRQQNIIKQKQQKIAKMQRMNLTQKQLEERQCTFRPAIKQYKGKDGKIVDSSVMMRTKNRQSILQNLDSCIIDSTIMMNQSYENNTQSSMITSTINQKDKNREKDETNCSEHEQYGQKSKNIASQTKQSNQKKTIDKAQPKKYKNSKFNMLLDLIH